MADNVRKWKDQAATQLRKGKYAKALSLFLKVVDADPLDFSCHNNIGYIHRKMGNFPEAAQVFGELTELYAKQGFLLKAIATCKVVLEIDPKHTGTQKNLADLYSKREGKAPVAVKVMTEEKSEAQIGEESAVPLSAAVSQPAPMELGEELAPIETMEVMDLAPEDSGLSFGELDLAPAPEMPASESQEPAGIELMPTTPPEALSITPMELVPEPVTASPEAIELEPVELDPVQAPAAIEPGAVELDPEPLVVSPEAVPVEAVPVEPVPVEAVSIEAAELVPDGIDLDVADFEAEPKLEKTLPKIALFSDLPADAFILMVEKMGMVSVRAGEWVVQEGQTGSSMFAIASGEVRVLKKLEGAKMIQLAVLGEGAFFGEMSVLRGGPRGASIQATKPSQLFEISEEVLSEVIGRYPAMGEVLKNFMTQRLLRNVMVTSALFQPFDREEKIRIVERFVSRDVDKGVDLISEGQESTGLFVLLRGKLEVSRKVSESEPTVVGYLEEGEVFGEISCLRKEPAMATVRTQQATSVLRLPRNDFDEVVLSHPQILELVNRLGEHRIALTMNKLAEKGILI